MRVELHPLFNVHFVLSEFFNVDLEERGYYQVRVVPKNTADFLSVEIIRDEAQNKEEISQSTNSTSNTSAGELTPSLIHNGAGVSKTVEVTYVDEKFLLDDIFTIAVQLQSTTHFEELLHLDIDLEIWFMDRYRPPKTELFQKIAKRSLQVGLDYKRVRYCGRAIDFECFNYASVSIIMYSSMVMIGTRRRKSQSDVMPSKLAKYHRNACEALLESTKSCQQFIQNATDVVQVTPLVMDEIDVNGELERMTSGMVGSENQLTRLETDCTELSARLTLIYQQMILLYGGNHQLFEFFFADHDKQRRSLLREAFFCTERTKNEAMQSLALNYADLFLIVQKSRYLQKLTRANVYCAEIDSPADLCSIVFEEVFNVGEVEVKRRSRCVPVKKKSITGRFRREASKLIKTRRKSADYQPKGERVKARESSSVPKFSELIRSSTAGSMAKETTLEEGEESEVVDRQQVRHEIELALEKPSSSHGGGHHPKDMEDAVEFLKERQAMMAKLQSRGFDGWLYGEKSVKGRLAPSSLPVREQYDGSRCHLVVFVHGLEGSHDDLLPYKLALKQAVNAFYRSCRLQNDDDEDEDEEWKFEYLMSRANQAVTWSNIRTMAVNLCDEVKSFECVGNVQRISFIGHSLGGIIVRTAVEMMQEWMGDRLHTLMTINTPHLGLAYVGRHVNIGMQVVKWWKRSESIDQLSLRDSLNFTRSFLYQLSSNKALGMFRNVLLIGSPDDMFVPACSALLEPSKHAVKDLSALGAAYREMMSNLLQSIVSSEKTSNFVRYVTFHQIPTANTNKITGRAGHIAAVEDLVFIEKLFAVSAIKYFV